MAIYRGYEIAQDLAEFTVRDGDEIIHRATSEEAALNWVDHRCREYMARLADGTRVTRAQFDQVNRYGVTTLNDGRVIDRSETLFCC